jgi:hypothetical protein
MVSIRIYMKFSLWLKKSLFKRTFKKYLKYYQFGNFLLSFRKENFENNCEANLTRILGIKSTSANWCVLRECSQEPLQFYWFRSAVKFWNTMVDSNSNTLRDVMKADNSLGNSGASNCWTRQMKDAFGDLQNGTVYRSDLFQCRKLNISNLRID